MKMLALWKKSYDKPRQCIKKQRHYFANKCVVKDMVFSVAMSGCESWTIKKAKNLQIVVLSNCGSGENSWWSLELQEVQAGQSERKSTLNIYWKDWCWSWSSNTLATWWEKLTHWKRRWCWERLKAGGERDDRGWGGCMASPTQWAWVWVNSRSWWWTGRPGMLQSMRLQRVRHNWVNELNWMKQADNIQPWHTTFPILTFPTYWH